MTLETDTEGICQANLSMSDLEENEERFNITDFEDIPHVQEVNLDNLDDENVTKTAAKIKIGESTAQVMRRA